ncbi:hypothetical protein M0R45_030400 [Rubus argutus]|uniref:Uncharacterized protein n=1 Tax=Rubus argutus TaxID=59490 RepID=A0AAW1WAZ0_RUBAR
MATVHGQTAKGGAASWAMFQQPCRGGKAARWSRDLGGWAVRRRPWLGTNWLSFFSSFQSSLLCFVPLYRDRKGGGQGVECGMDWRWRWLLVIEHGLDWIDAMMEIGIL